MAAYFKFFGLALLFTVSTATSQGATDQPKIVKYQSEHTLSVDVPYEIISQKKKTQTDYQEEITKTLLETEARLLRGCSKFKAEKAQFQNRRLGATDSTTTGMSDTIDYKGNDRCLNQEGPLRFDEKCDMAYIWDDGRTYAERDFLPNAVTTNRTLKSNELFTVKVHGANFNTRIYLGLTNWDCVEITCFIYLRYERDLFRIEPNPRTWGRTFNELKSGDQLALRHYDNGTVMYYKNGVALEELMLQDMPRCLS